MMAAELTKRRFHGPWITAAIFVSFGITVGVPYYGMPFFYDYFTKTFGWTRPQITLGFPLGAILTLWVGPALVHRYSARKMILIGAFCTFLAFVGFGLMGGSLFLYYLLWTLYRGGNIFCGPIPYQLIVSEWYKKRRGSAMAIAYLGVGVFGAVSARYIAQPLTEAFGFRAGLIGIGALMFLAVPLVLFLLRDRPSDCAQYPDGESAPRAADRDRLQPAAFPHLLRQPAFWLITVGSFCSIGAIGVINQHMKLIFLDQFHEAHLTGPDAQRLLDGMFGAALLCIMLASNIGRLGIGYLADRFSKKLVMVATYLLLAVSVPLALRVHPPQIPYLFVFLFGLAMGGDYMMIPLVTAEQFGLPTMARAMSIILPVDTMAQACVPYLASQLRESFGDYGHALWPSFVLAILGAVSISLVPKVRQKETDVGGVLSAEAASARYSRETQAKVNYFP